MTGDVDGFGQDSRRFLRGVEAHRVFGVDEVGLELRRALRLISGGELFVGRALVLGGLYVVNQPDHGVFRAVEQGLVAVLNQLHAGLHFFARVRMADEAGALDVAQRTAHPMVAHLHGALALVGHVAIGAGDSGAGMDALVVEFELGMLRFEHRRSGLGVLPIAELDLVVVGFDVVHLQAFRPRIGDRFAFGLEIVLNVTLAADEGAHFLPRGHRVGVVVVDPLGRLHISFDPVEEPWAGHTQGHRFGIVAVDAADGVRHFLARFLERHGADGFKTFLDVAVAGFAPDLGHGGVAMQARSGLGLFLGALGLVLVLERIGVAAFLAIVEGEGVAGENGFETRVLVQFGERFRAAVSRAGLGSGDRGELKTVVLAREVLAPFGWFERVLGEVRDGNVVQPRFLLAGKDVDQQQRDEHRGQRGDGGDSNVFPAG